ncbi:MAG: PQQ-binding-like beta-propeller repeat protein [Archangium sp.]
MPPPSESPQGALVAWDPVKGKEAWSVARRAPVNGGTVATAGNLVFQGTAEGHFTAYTADTGKEVWSFDAHNGIVGAPITFTAGGKQYISVLTGYGALAAVAGEDSARYNWQYRQQHRRLLTFAIGGTAKLPENEAIPPLTFLDDPTVKLKDADVEKGSIAFARCMVCHGPGAVAGGAAPDLRASPIALQAASFKAIVHGGGLESAGMPKFDELSDEELEQMRSFIRFRARKAIKETQKL